MVKPALAGLLAVLLLSLSAMAASPALHQWLHSDAGAANHECAVTLFAKGQVNAAVVAAVAAVIAAFFGGVALLADSLVVSFADYRFSSSRAPPRSLPPV